MPQVLSAQLKGERTVLEPTSSGFPPALLDIPKPPKRLYVIGNVRALAEGLAVVGARKATPYGLRAARLFAGMAAERGIVVVSGGALGCDSASHEAALEKGGVTVAFLGGGCDQVYPAQNFGLFQRIVDAGGAVVSENPWEVPPQPYTFRARNRLIAGLARATLIVEAGLPSGTFSTADEALEANKDVMVVPGSIFSATSKGANRLLSQGAVPVVDEETFADLLSSLFPLAQPKGFGAQGQMSLGEIDGAAGAAAPVLDDGARKVLKALTANPMRIERAMEVFADDASVNVGESIGLLEMLGLVCRYPDGRFGSR